ncbi:hypothetical protein [Glycomyces buryatensis]|uniref:Uncharacterized protein n=1 Tax=Glycomyces buryatensis TaxID=2570927 RepID=A0A4V4HSM6_9ACTN|nr:hypothetical protein [Glycomyces buryatensis]THV42196.1 hypothetical protein FAB82_08160 [Glycomyces buryatensis]
MNVTPSGPDLYLGNVYVQDSHFLVCRSCGYTERYVNSDRLHLIEQRGRSLAEAQAIAQQQNG